MPSMWERETREVQEGESQEGLSVVRLSAPQVVQCSDEFDWYVEWWYHNGYRPIRDLRVREELL